MTPFSHVNVAAKLAVTSLAVSALIGCSQAKLTSWETLEHYLSSEVTGDYEQMYRMISTPDRDTWRYEKFLGQHQYDQIRELRLSLTRHEIVSLDEDGNSAFAIVKSTHPDLLRISQELFGKDDWWREQQRPGAADRLRAYIEEKSSWYADSSVTEYRMTKEDEEWRLVFDFSAFERTKPFLISERKLDESGNTQGAVDAVRKALEIDPDNKHVQRRLETLEAKIGYLQNIQVSNLAGNKKGYGRPSLRGTFKNLGQRTIDQIGAQIFYLDRGGSEIAEEHAPRLMINGNLKPNYEHDFYHTMFANIPSSWSGEVRVEVNRFAFEDECELVSAHLARWICYE